MYSRPKISVVIPAHNTAPYLPECLESLFRQTFQDFEAILVNDGSTDDTPAVAARFKRIYPQIIYLEQPHSGIFMARQTGVRRAEGEYVCFLDSDDFISPNYLQALYHAAQTRQAQLALAQTGRYFTPEKIVREDAAVFKRDVLEGSARACLLEGFSECMSLCGKLIQAEVARAVSWPDTEGQEDIFPSVQMAALARRIATAPEAVYYYRQQRPGSLSAAVQGRFVRTWEAFSAADNFFRRSRLYEAFAPGLEYTRWRVLLGHAAQYGLTTEEYDFVKQHAADVARVSARTLKGRPWKLRAQFVLLKQALAWNLPYPFLLKTVWKTGHTFRLFFQRLFGRKGGDKQP